MAGEEHLSLGNKAFLDKEYLVAKKEYTKAIELEPENPKYYFKRSTCNAKLNEYLSAEYDAVKSIELDSTNQDAYLSLGIARYSLKSYETAKTAFENALGINAENKNASIWIQKCQTEIQNSAKNKIRKEEEQTTALASPPIRHDWYQTEQHVVLSVMAKNCQKNNVEVELEKQSLSISVKLPSGRNYNLEFELAHPIVVEESGFKVLSTKIEVKMKKCEGIRWSSLENQNEPNYSTFDTQESGKANEAVRQYPTSSMKHHDWEKLAVNIENEEKNEKKEGEDGLNQLFQKIYADANDDTRRAMNKSFLESGGTVLSTNWKDIGAKKVECKPPDGMEFKKYEY